MLWLSMENVLSCDSELKASEARNTICKTHWNPRPRRGPRRVRSVKARNFSQILMKRSRRQFLLQVALLRSRGWSSSTDVLVNSSVPTSVLFLRVLESNRPALLQLDRWPALLQLDRCASMKSKARDFEKFTNLVLTWNAFSGLLSRKSVQGLVKIC